MGDTKIPMFHKYNTACYLVFFYCLLIELILVDPFFVCADPLPKIIAPDPVFDFGVIREGYVVEHEFSVENRGEVDLEIKRVLPACGCSFANLSSNVVRPGSSLLIKTSFDSTGFAGNETKTFRVYTNDPTMPSLILTMQGDVRRDVAVTPSRIYFGEVVKGSAKIMSAVAFVDIDSSAVFQEISSRSQYLDVRNEPLSEKNRKGYRISITLKKNSPIGVLREQIVIKTTSEKTPVLTLPVFAKIKGDLSVIPSDIYFGSKENSDTYITENVLRLFNASKQKVKVMTIDSDIEDLNVAGVKEVIPGKEFEIVVRVSGKSKMQEGLNGKLVIGTDHKDEDQKTLVVPIYWRK